MAGIGDANVEERALGKTAYASMMKQEDQVRAERREEGREGEGVLDGQVGWETGREGGRAVVVCVELGAAMCERDFYRAAEFNCSSPCLCLSLSRSLFLFPIFSSPFLCLLFLALCR